MIDVILIENSSLVTVSSHLCLSIFMIDVIGVIIIVNSSLAIVSSHLCVPMFMESSPKIVFLFHCNKKMHTRY